MLKLNILVDYAAETINFESFILALNKLYLYDFIAGHLGYQGAGVC